MDETGEQRPNILVIDDDPFNLEIMGKRLARHNFQFQLAPTGMAGLACLKAIAFDLVLLDLRLPDFTDFELLKVIQELRPATPVIMMTAHGSVEVAAQAIQLGAAQFLLKPVSRLALAAAIEAALRREDGLGV
jgi:DNA-binding NtrC family response regulator